MVDVIFWIFMIVNEKGLYVCVLVKFVEMVEGFDVLVEVSKDGLSVGGDSIMGFLMLVVFKGIFIEVEINGLEVFVLVDVIEVLVVDKFGEGF